MNLEQRVKWAIANKATPHRWSHKYGGTPMSILIEFVEFTIARNRAFSAALAQGDVH